MKPLLRLLRAAWPAAALLLLAGCGPRTTRVEYGNTHQILYLGNLTEPTDLDPQIITSQSDFNIVMSLMEGLTENDPQDLHPVPGVAEKWSCSPDGLEWTFHLRPDAKWSNGDPVTAQDFMFSYRRMLSPGLASEYAYMLYFLKNAEAYNNGRLADFAQVGVKAPDDRTLVFTLAHPTPFFPSLLAHSSWYPVHPATILKFGPIDRRGTAWTRPGNYVGNGPFVLAQWSPNQVIRVTKSPTYWNHAAVKLNEIDFFPIENDATEEAAFRSGQLHITSTIPIEKIAVYKREHPEWLHQETMLATYFYRFNVTRPPLNDVRVRRALALAINRREIVEHVAKGGQQPAFTLDPPDIAGFTARPVWHEDPAEARRLLAEAGYPDGRGFPHIDILYNTSEGHRQIAEAIQQMWRKNLHIDVGIYNQEAKVESDSMRQLNYFVARYAWSGDYLDPSTFLDILISDSGNNQTGWKNPAYDRLMRESRQTTDQAKRFALFQRAEAILGEDMPIMPIYFYTRNNLRLPVVKGWYGNLLDLHPYQGVYLAP